MNSNCIFKSKRIGFSLWNESDYNLAYGLWSDKEVTSLIGGPFIKEQIIQRLTAEIDSYNKFKVQYFPIFNLSSGQFLGCAGLRPINEQNEIIFECGIHLHTYAQGKGLGTEALTTVIQYGYALGIDKIYAGHNPKNIASKNLLLKIGFKYLYDNYYEPTGLMHPWYVISKT